jgi:hypothetical protein
MGGNAKISSVSCASAGNCSAGGYYTDGSRRQQALVVSETSGTWQQAEEVPGTAALNKGANFQGSAEVSSVSCASAGNCSAGGFYVDPSSELASSGQQLAAFVVSEVNGTWQRAEEVPGSAALNKGGSAGINAVSCPSAGNCSASGGPDVAFVVSEP